MLINFYVEIYAGMSEHLHQFVVDFYAKKRKERKKENMFPMAIIKVENKQAALFLLSLSLAMGSAAACSTPEAFLTGLLDSHIASHCGDQFVANKKNTNFILNRK